MLGCFGIVSTDTSHLNVIIVSTLVSMLFSEETKIRINQTQVYHIWYSKYKNKIYRQHKYLDTPA